MGRSGVATHSLRIVLLGDGAWAANSMLRLQVAGHRVVGVVARTHPSDSTLLEAAYALGLPIWQPANVNRPEMWQAIAALAPDLALSISYNQILRRPLLEIAPFGCVNIHAGKLPYYRGRNVVNWAIINGEREIGLTAHRVDEGIDTGDILIQRTLPIHWTDSYGDVLSRVIDAVPDLALETVDLIASGQAQPQPQAHLSGTYFSGREDGDEWLDWSDTSYNLYNKIRAISRPGPGARTLLGDKVVLIWGAHYDPAWAKYIATPGQIIGRCPGEGALVKTGDSTLLVREVQIEGGACEPPSWRIGTRLGINLSSVLQTIMVRLNELERQTRHGRDVDEAS